VTDSEPVAGAKMVRQIQTSVFDESCNVYMPYYRQISMPAPGSDYPGIINYISGFDATDALDYFLTNLNEGRPFILAGHSQGAATLLALLENYMTKHPEALKRMVAAYPIGYAVTKDFLARTGLKFAEGATDTGVIVSWNTEGAANVDAKLYGIPADGAALFGSESYHLHDYGFFYNNFKQNVTDRVKAYMEK